MSEPKVTRRKLTEYTPDPQNANAGTERGARMLEDSVQEVGAGRSLVASADGVIVAGNKTLQALADAQITDVLEVETDGHTAVVVKRTDWDSRQHPGAQRYAYLDNRAGEVGLAWDPAQIVADMQAGFDFDGIFADDELAAILAGLDGGGGAAPEPEDPDADDFGEVRPMRGDVWLIASKTLPGQVHRVMCGDSTDTGDVSRLMEGRKADAVVTDPPYGIGHDTNYTRFTGGLSDSRNFEAPIFGDDLPFDPTPIFNMAPVVLLWGANNYPQRLAPGTFLIWDKRHDGQEKLLSDGEVAWLNQGHGTYIFNHAWNGFLRDSERGATLHPTQKPVVLFEWCMRWIPTGAVVFDPYAGSGPVLLAAENTRRLALLCEIEPRYVEVILRRAEAAGLPVVREGGAGE